MYSELLDWLTEPEDPSLCYRVFRELQDRDNRDPEVRARRSEIPGSPAARKLLGSMHPDGYWLQTHPRTGRVIGAGVEYGAFATTHFCLSYLAELGLDRNNPQIERAAERYLDLQSGDGDWYEEGWYEHLSCLQGYNIRTFVRLGYRDDLRLKRTIGLLLGSEREDGGYLCGIHDRRYKTKQAKSCIRGSVKALLCFAELPELQKHPRVARLVQYFLNRGGIFKSSDPRVFANADMQRPSFPITWRANAWEVLYALSVMGHGDDPRLDSAWKHLESLTDDRGASVLSWTPVQCPWKVGKRGQPNKWLTFYALAAAKHRRKGSRLISQSGE
jgi:hypothetical protein